MRSRRTALHRASGIGLLVSADVLVVYLLVEYIGFLREPDLLVSLRIGQALLVWASLSLVLAVAWLATRSAERRPDEAAP
jgi:hypothetical protein